MNMKKLRLYAAGVVAFLIGMPLTERAFAGTSGVIDASVDLAGAIMNSAGRS